ncbi:hypothetical protein [Nocardioides kribbensis]|uniref:DUF2892 domain-containing protein n=1 Tax=Nocardioides kribbensis TaxID=305517 RepID=A0ABV1P069_9ACTN
MTTTTRAPEDDPVRELFASGSVAGHLVRGVVGLVLAVAGLGLAGQSAWWLLLLPLAVVSWRGCPTCWTLGLAQTLSRGRAERVCDDAGCRPVRSSTR